jgi:hypothetical protein
LYTVKPPIPFVNPEADRFNWTSSFELEVILITAADWPSADRANALGASVTWSVNGPLAEDGRAVQLYPLIEQAYGFKNARENCGAEGQKPIQTGPLKL